MVFTDKVRLGALERRFNELSMRHYELGQQVEKLERRLDSFQIPHSKLAARVAKLEAHEPLYGDPRTFESENYVYMVPADLVADADFDIRDPELGPALYALYPDRVERRAKHKPLAPPIPEIDQIIALLMRLRDKVGGPSAP